jgi:hypothetical protein
MENPRSAYFGAAEKVYKHPCQYTVRAIQRTVTIMSASELEALGLDAAVTTQLQAVISSDQLDNDAITEKLTELFGGHTRDGGVEASASIQGTNVEVVAPSIHKIFKGQWDREYCL